MKKAGPLFSDPSPTILYQLYAHSDFTTLPALMISLLAQVVPCDISTYNEIDRRTNELRSVHNYHCGDPEEYFPQFMAHISEHPTCNYAARTGDTSPLKISDFLSQSEFQKTGLYNEFYRIFGVRYQIAFFFEYSPEFHIAIALKRQRRDFTEAERIVLRRLSPHFNQAWHNSRLLYATQQTLGEVSSAISGMGHGITLLDRSGEVQWMTEHAQRWLVQYFPGHTGNRLPERVRDWSTEYGRQSREEFFNRPPQPLEIRREGRRLIIRRLPGDEGGTRLLFTEKIDGRSPLDASGFGLTRRESEVLHWLCEGKSNAEIGIILGRSSNTMRKHMEHIFAKLGVENRAAAVRLMSEQIRDAG